MIRRSFFAAVASLFFVKPLLASPVKPPPKPFRATPDGANDFLVLGGEFVPVKVLNKRVGSLNSHNWVWEQRVLQRCDTGEKLYHYTDKQAGRTTHIEVQDAHGNTLS